MQESESKTLKCVGVYSAEAGAESESKILDAVYLWVLSSKPEMFEPLTGLGLGPDYAEFCWIWIGSGL